MDRRYHLIVVRTFPAGHLRAGERYDAAETRLTARPCTHEEACTIRSKWSPYRAKRSPFWTDARIVEARPYRDFAARFAPVVALASKLRDDAHAAGYPPATLDAVDEAYHQIVWSSAHGLTEIEVEALVADMPTAAREAGKAACDVEDGAVGVLVWSLFWEGNATS